MFQIRNNSRGKRWYKIDSSSTLYIGQFCQFTGDGVGPLAVASGAGDTSNKQCILGIVRGTNDYVKQNDETYGNYISGVTSQANQVARDWRSYGSNDRNNPLGESAPLVEVELIGPETLIEGPFYNAAISTAPTLLTITTGSESGLGFTSNACQMTPVNALCTSYCRSGANGGLIRISSDVSTTVETNTLAFKEDIAVGDTFVRVPAIIGRSYVQLNATNVGLWLEASASPATDYFIVTVHELELSVANEESAIFAFDPCHFDLVRA